MTGWFKCGCVDREYNSLPRSTLFPRGLSWQDGHPSEFSLQPLSPSISLLRPRASTMATNSPQTKPKGRNRAVSTLNGLINILNIAKDACAIKPARVAFGSVGELLTTIRVRSLLFYDYEPQTHVCSGHRGRQKGVCRHRINLRQCV